MTLMDEYGENKEKEGIQIGIQKGEDRIISNLLRSGHSPQKVAIDCGIPIVRVNQIKAELQL